MTTKAEIEEKRKDLQGKVMDILSWHINEKSKLRILSAIYTPFPSDADDLVVDRIYEGWDEIEDYE